MVGQMGMWVKKVVEQEVGIFLTDSCKLTIEEIMGAQNFNFDLTFRKMGFSSPNSAFWTSFQTRKNVQTIY